MEAKQTCRVVAVRTDGSRLVLSRNNAPEVAEKIVGLVKHGTSYSEVRIEPEADGEAGAARARKKPR